MVIYIIACIASFIPSIGVFLWLRKRGDEVYKKVCNMAFRQGVLCVLPITLFSGVSYVLIRLTGVQDTNPLLYQALYTFIVLALAEESAKFLAFKKVLKKSEYEYSWLDLVAFMTIVSIGFGVIESVLYAIGASVPVVLVRGICVPHAGYGFIIGYFYGRGLKRGNKADKIIGFLLALALHGMYDFSLSDEFVALHEYIMFVALFLAIADIVLVIILIVFANKVKNNPEYVEPIQCNAHFIESNR